LLREINMKFKDNMSIRKKYMRDIYSKYWITSREKKYGFSEYDKNLIEYITKNVGRGRLLEVGIGTGYPFADYFQKKGYDVYGIDISPLLVEKCKRLFPDVNCVVGDAENLPYEDCFFDVVYCFHSTWYFPDLIKAISEMMRVAVPKGLVIFDIQNLNNNIISSSYLKRLSRYNNRFFYYPIHFMKNIVKIFLGRKDISWRIVLHEVPTRPETLYDYFRKSKINYKVMVRNEDDSLGTMNSSDSFVDFSRLVFAIIK